MATKARPETGSLERRSPAISASPRMAVARPSRALSGPSRNSAASCKPRADRVGLLCWRHERAGSRPRGAGRWPREGAGSDSRFAAAPDRRCCWLGTDIVRTSTIVAPSPAIHSQRLPVRSRSCTGRRAGVDRWRLPFATPGEVRRSWPILGIFPDWAFCPKQRGTRIRHVGRAHTGPALIERSRHRAWRLRMRAESHTRGGRPTASPRRAGVRQIGGAGTPARFGSRGTSTNVASRRPRSRGASHRPDAGCAGRSSAAVRARSPGFELVPGGASRSPDRGDSTSSLSHPPSSRKRRERAWTSGA